MLPPQAYDSTVVNHSCQIYQSIYVRTCYYTKNIILTYKTSFTTLEKIPSNYKSGTYDAGVCAWRQRCTIAGDDQHVL